jgi:hypothetical protein
MSKAGDKELDRVKRWRLRAAEWRLLASEATSTIARGQLLNLADLYEAMASDAEALLKIRSH